MTLHRHSNGDTRAQVIRQHAHHASTTMSKSRSTLPNIDETSRQINNTTLSLSSPCELCDVIPSQNANAANDKYPVLCSTEKCQYNICSFCISQLLSNSRDESPLQASDGNHFNLKLQCPNCRGDFCVSLEDVLLLRRGEVWKLELENVSDMELSASDLREKYIWDQKLIEELRLAGTRYVKVSKTALDPCDSDTLSEDLSLESTMSDESVLSPPSPPPPPPPPPRNSMQLKITKELDNMLLAGLEDTMTTEEQIYITSFMTSGCPDKLAQAAELVSSIAEVRSSQLLTSLTLTQTFDPTPSVPMTQGNFTPRPLNGQTFGGLSQPAQFTRAKSMSQTPKQKLPFRAQPISHQGKSIGYARGGISTSSATARNPSSRASTLGEIRQWRRSYPLPVRMPHTYSIHLNFDPYSRWGSNVTFLDDMESFANFHSPPGKRKTKQNIVKDAYERLTVGMWNNICRERIAIHHINGVNNLLAGPTRPDFAPVLPFRRVLISSVRGELRQTGLQVGDVVTHVNGEAFDGSAEKLRCLIMRYKEKETFKHGNEIVHPKMQIVVNAEAGTAEVLRLRSETARAALKKLQS